MLRRLKPGYSWLLLLLSTTGLFLSLWTVIPAPNLQLLPLAVGAPEISPWLMGLNLAAMLFAIANRRRTARLGLCFSLVGLCFSALPLIQLPATIQSATAAIQQGLGTDYLKNIPAQLQTQMRPQPFNLTEVFTGFSTPTVRQDSVQLAAPNGTRLELYRPPTAGVYPTLVTIYGGAWQHGNPSDNAAFNRYIAAQGYTVVAIDYRHAPDYQFPVQLQDVQRALQLIRQQAATYEIDPARMAVMGWSAGAHLAMLAAYESVQSAPPLRAVVSYYGPTDLVAGYNDLPDPDPIDVRAVLSAFMGGSPSQLPSEYRAASPINAVKPQLPPTLLIYGSRDHIVKVSFGRQMFRRLKTVGTTAVFIEIPWAEHAFDAVFNGLSNQLALYYTERFLAWALQP